MQKTLFAVKFEAIIETRKRVAVATIYVAKSGNLIPATTAQDLNIDETQTPKAQPQRRISYNIRGKVESALEELENNGIIERVPENQPTSSLGFSESGMDQKRTVM